jgi:hypothetical protein
MTPRFAPIACAPLVSALFASLLLSSLPARAQTLEPPPPMTAPPPAYPSYPTPASLPNTPPPVSREESQDSGLGLEWVWINAEIGGAYVNMESLSTSNLALQKTESGGPMYGVAAGVRLLFLTLGVRVRDLDLSSIGNLWELSAEAKFHTRIWRIDPYLGVRGGYNFVGTLNSDSVPVATGSTPASVSVHGFDVGPVFGIDFYLMKLISIGADVDAQLLFLQRPVPPLPAALTAAGVTVASLPPNVRTLYESSGSSVGFGVTGSAHLGIHF